MMEMNLISRFAVVLCVFMAARVPYATAGEFQTVKDSNRFNKPAVKSIKSPDGDIIDCVRISHQPALDHPSLKNHKIQMRPNFHPEGTNYESMQVSSETQQTVTQLWRLNGNCPEGTIPIRRTKKEDILRASSIKNYGKKSSISTLAHPNSIDLDLINQSGHEALVGPYDSRLIKHHEPRVSLEAASLFYGVEHAIAYVEGEFYGAKAAMNVWSPQIQQSNEFSLSQIWLLGGSFASDLNSIEAGWQVSPDLYGDNNTRFFTYWTSDAYQATGCYNLLCSGFIQINNEIALGASISPISKYQGSQYDISLLVWKDPEQGNWWMQFGNGHVLGYWPASLFSYLTESASMIQWGGEVVNLASDGQHTTTQMGSGHFPGEGFGKTSYFRNVQVVDGSNSLRAPEDINTFTEKPNCYDVQMGKNGGWGNYIYYGGPGRNPNCP